MAKATQCRLKCFPRGSTITTSSSIWQPQKQEFPTQSSLVAKQSNFPRDTTTASTFSLQLPEATKAEHFVWAVALSASRFRTGADLSASGTHASGSLNNRSGIGTSQPITQYGQRQTCRNGSAALRPLATLRTTSALLPATSNHPKLPGTRRTVTPSMG